MPDQSQTSDVHRLARVAHALSNPVRQRLLQVLFGGEFSVSELADASDQTHANASAQLKVLLECGLVEARKSGRKVIYKLRDATVLSMWSAIAEMTDATTADAEDGVVPLWTLQRGREAMELLEAVERGEVQLVDSRTRPEFEAARLAGALWHGDRLDPDKRVVIYGRCRFCGTAGTVREDLVEQGFDVQQLGYGVAEVLLCSLPLLRA